MHWILRTLGDIESGWVLDVATGTGRFVEDLRFAFSFGSQPRAGNVKIIGVDWLRGAVAHASKDGQDVHYLAMDAARLGFPDNSFGVVCLVRALHHMTDATQVQALAEMYRVLKPDGRFFVAEMYRDGQSETQMTDVLLHHWVAAVETAIKTVAHPKAVRWVHRETFLRGQIVRLVESIGLRELRCCDVAFPHQDEYALEPWMIEAEEKEIDRYLNLLLKGPRPVPDSAALCSRAEALRQRLHTVGFNSATLLVAVGIKRV
jgi:ubiquinone/menaquinone biosynthesis C-methylase UbiE